MTQPLMTETLHGSSKTASSCTSAKKKKDRQCGKTRMETGESLEQAEDVSMLGRKAEGEAFRNITNKLHRRPQHEGPSSEALPNVHRAVEEEDDPLGHSWIFLRHPPPRGEGLPILQLNKTETGKILLDRTTGSRIWRPHLSGPWIGKDWRKNWSTDCFGWSHITFDNISMQTHFSIRSRH